MTSNFLTPFLGSSVGGAIGNLFRPASENYFAVINPKPSLTHNIVYGVGAGCLLNTAFGGAHHILKKIYSAPAPLQSQSNFLSNSALALGGGLTALGIMKYLDTIQNYKTHQANQDKKK